MEGVVEAAGRSNDVIADAPGWKAAALLQLGRKEEAHAALLDLRGAVTRSGKAGTLQKWRTFWTGS